MHVEQNSSRTAMGVYGVYGQFMDTPLVVPLTSKAKNRPNNETVVSSINHY